MLSDSETDSNENFQITVNEHYANAYARKKEREELSKLKEKYGSDFEYVSGSGEEESDESDVTEDEDGEELTPAMDAAILRTLARIKRRDPEIYNNEKHIFEEEKISVGEPTSVLKEKTKVSKPVTIKQQALSSMLNTTSRSPSPQPLTYEQEQQALRAEAISAFHDAVKEDEDDLLISREKGKDEIEKEEEDYRDFLAREVGEDIRTLVDLESDSRDTRNHAVADKSPQKETLKKDTKTNSKLAADEEFLMNYILNRGWIDRDAKRIPTYGEITRKDQQLAEESNIQEDDEEFEEIADNFESSYNFRFEEPDGATIATYPRNLTSTVRRHDTKRKEARERRKQRREEELSKKREEVKRLKALKAKELRQKLEKIEREGGIEIDAEVLANFDLDDDWDPQKHDEQMAMMYEGDEENQEEGKPHWDHDIDIGDALVARPYETDTAAKTKKKGKRKRVEDDGDADGADIDTMQMPEDWDGTEDTRKKKVQEFLDEVYGMDFNDIVGDIPTRFSYIQVAPQNYGLSSGEILQAADADLNQFMGLKKLASYRKDRQNYDSKRTERLKEFKDRLKTRQKDTASFDEEFSERPSKKRKGKKERQRARKEEKGEVKTS